jgi:hypothetical protein
MCTFPAAVADDMVLYEAKPSHRSSNAAAESADEAAAAAEQEQHFDAQEAEAHGAR